MYESLENKAIKGHLENSKTSPEPNIDCYFPKPNFKNKISIIIFPGGGYHHLAAHEGLGYANYFNSYGFTCFVVTYRLAPQQFKHPAMLEDALSAINVVRKNAEAFGIDPNKIGVMGSSAGGHLAAHCLVNNQIYPNNTDLKPNFAILCYPVIIMDNGEFCNQGSRNNLIGESPSPEIVEEVTILNKVNPKTAPCFIWHTTEDKPVPIENSFFLANELRKHNVPFEIHAFQKGKHGLGLNKNLQWMAQSIRWLNELWEN